MMKDVALYNHSKNPVVVLSRNRQHGSYHEIRAPDGVVSIWAVEGEERGPFPNLICKQEKDFGGHRGHTTRVREGIIRFRPEDYPQEINGLKK